MGVKTARKIGTVDYIQWDGSANSTAEIIEWAARFGTQVYLSFSYSDYGTHDVLKIQTREGLMESRVGSYCCKGAENEFWFVQKDIFEKTYQEV